MINPVNGPAPLDELDTVTLTERARAAILEAILGRRFTGKLPTEDELTRMLKVSRTTVRAALQSLEQDGVVTRTRAIGTRINPHVAPATLALQRLVGFDALLREQGHEVEVQSSWKHGSVPSPLLEALGGEPEGDALVTDKRYLADGKLALHIRDVVLHSALRAEPPQGETLPASLFEFSRLWMKDPIDHAVVQLVPMVKERNRSTALTVAPGRPYLRLLERHYSRRADVLAMSVIDLDDRFIRLEVFRRSVGPHG